MPQRLYLDLVPDSPISPQNARVITQVPRLLTSFCLTDRLRSGGIKHEENPAIFTVSFRVPDSVGSRSFESSSHEPGGWPRCSLGHALHGCGSAQRRGPASRRIETGAHPWVGKNFERRP